MENDNDNNTESPHNADDVVAPEVDPELDLEELAKSPPVMPMISGRRVPPSTVRTQ